MKQTTELLKDLKEKWEKWRDVSWPGLPPFHSDLREPACDLMTQDTFVAGCISQIVQKESLDRKLWHILVVDQNLTNRISNANDHPLKRDLLNYKIQMDELICLARTILGLENS
ncbi:MAG: hypothetical protein GY833_01560 [Aestuariibacter sp.]|nr:hypothetical protein [Aestuariibacter sp.]